MRIGIFGGSFDPVHLGHLWIAEAAMQDLSLDQLRWIPVATSPLKRKGPVAENHQRLEMLRLAISGRDGFVLDDCEIRRDGVSFTVDTVGHLQASFPGNEWYLIIGSDSLATMNEWHQPSKLLEQVTLAVVQRGGDPDVDFSVLDELTSPERIALFRSSVIQMSVIEISSSEIREAVGQGRAVRYKVPRAVEAYIENEQLYR